MERIIMNNYGKCECVNYNATPNVRALMFKNWYPETVGELAWRLEAIRSAPTLVFLLRLLFWFLLDMFEKRTHDKDAFCQRLSSLEKLRCSFPWL